MNTPSAIVVATILVCFTSVHINNSNIEAQKSALRESNEMLAKALSEPEKPVSYGYSDMDIENGTYAGDLKAQPEPIKKAPRRRIIVDGKPLITPAE